MFLVCSWLEQLRNLLQHLAERERLVGQGHFTRLQLTEVQNIIQDVQQCIAALLNDLCILSLLL
ncbi:hypothetical protein D3C74_450040 [compost metagenome]